ncbi:MAG TPA: aminotransferase class V-fold PLP-dependent enzyme, partial [Limnochordia bacterium]|nr:aminotransferase class V-fold PLP-dependent enzyme [Limnochordia bacterium]
MKRIYLDNAATSFPKAPGVGDAVKHFIDDIGDNVNRSGYDALASDEMVFETREMLAQLFNFPTPENVVFTLNITYGLNFLLKGLLEPGDHVIVSSMEHNAVMRPLMQLQERGVEFSRLVCDEVGKLNANSLYPMIRPNTKMVVLTHASNVSGTILPVEEIGAICQERGLWFVLDTAQTAGILPVDFQSIKTDALTFTGHKGLLGPQGIGGFLLTQELAERMETLVSGGTGSLSEYEEVPPYLPDKFEAGTP